MGESLDEDTHSLSDVDTEQYKPLQLTKDDEIPIGRSRTNVLILLGIKDDITQDLQEPYTSRGDLEERLINELETISNKTSFQDQNITNLNDPEVESDYNDSKYPPKDKGIAWIMAICACLAIFSTWGSNASYGVFLNYYMANETFANASKYDYALIGGLVMFCAQFLAPIAALAYKIVGFRLMMAVGVILQTLGYILASFSTKLWQIYLTQGLLIGVSFVCIFIPATLILPGYFDKYLSTAMGICVAGSGLGGLVFSLSLNAVIEKSGNQKWGLRMVGIVTLVTALIPAVIMKPRIDTKSPIKQTLKFKFISDNFKVIFNFKVFKSYPLLLITFWFALTLLGYTIMLFSMASYARSVGLTPQQGSTLTSVMNAAQIVGRPCMGLIADSIGRNNLSTLVSASITILIFAFWINAKSFGSLVGYVVLIGLIIGVGSTMAQSMASDVLFDQVDLPAAWSGMNLLVGISTLVAEVIALSLVNNSISTPYLYAQIFTGSCFFVCLCLLLVVREYLVRRKFKQRLALAESTVVDSADSKEALDEMTILQQRVDRYNFLLRRNLWAFVIRMFYPVRV